MSHRDHYDDDQRAAARVLDACKEGRQVSLFTVNAALWVTGDGVGLGPWSRNGLPAAKIHDTKEESWKSF